MLQREYQLKCPENIPDFLFKWPSVRQLFPYNVI